MSKILPIIIVVLPTKSNVIVKKIGNQLFRIIDMTVSCNINLLSLRVDSMIIEMKV